VSEAPFALERQDDAGFRVAGRIEVGNAAQAMAAGTALLGAGRPVEVDLKDLRSADSVTLAVLLEWSARARQRGGGLLFRNVPQRVCSIAHLSDAEGLLGLN